MEAALAFLHGSGYTPAIFAEQATAFPNARSLALPGHPDGQALESVEEMARWFDARLPRTSEPIVAAGNSLGGAIALRWALNRPTCAAGLVLIGTGARLRVAPEIFTMIDESWPACAAELVALALAPGAAVALRARALACHLAVGQQTTRSDYAACDGFDVRAELGSLSLPVLIIVGSEDRMTPPKYAEFLHAHIAGSRLAVIEGAGHLAMAERPGEVNAAIEAFLRRL